MECHSYAKNEDNTGVFIQGAEIHTRDVTRWGKRRRSRSKKEKK